MFAHAFALLFSLAQPAAISGMAVQARVLASVDATPAYGADPRQRVDYYAPAEDGDRPPPIALYIHGGGWAAGSHRAVGTRPDEFRARHWAFASLGYRLLPDAPVETQLADLAAAIRLLRRDARLLGFDPDRLMLIGHSSGAHLAAMLATDPQWLGDDFAAIRAVLLLDGTSYDVVAQIEATGAMAQRYHIPAFGTDPERQRALSPLFHAAAPNAPDWLIVHAGYRADFAPQAGALAGALQRAGAEARIAPVALPHMDIDRMVLSPEFPSAAEVSAIMRRVETR